MNDAEWVGWAERHATTFGLLTEAEREMVHHWRDFFESEGYTILELQEASRALMADPPKWRADHLKRIQETIVARRLKQARAEKENEEEQARKQDYCPRCNTREGWLEVPHPETIRGDQWTRPYLTLLVTCDCTRGRVRFNQFAAAAQNEEFTKKVPSFRPALAIDAYERRFPHWEMMVQQRDLAREQEAKAMGRAAHADRHRGPIPPVSWTEVAEVEYREKRKARENGKLEN